MGLAAEGSFAASSVGNGTKPLQNDANGNSRANGAFMGYDNRLLSDNTAAFTYNNEGGRQEQDLAQSKRLYQYDHANALVEVKETTLTGALKWTISYVYDAEGNRVASKYTPTSISGNSVPAWEDRFANVSGHAIAEMRDSNNLKVSYLRGDGVDQLFGRVDVTNASNNFLGDFDCQQDKKRCQEPN